jgi:hypothetical protein
VKKVKWCDEDEGRGKVSPVPGSERFILNFLSLLIREFWNLIRTENISRVAGVHRFAGNTVR